MATLNLQFMHTFIFTFLKKFPFSISYRFYVFVVNPNCLSNCVSHPKFIIIAHILPNLYTEEQKQENKIIKTGIS